MLAALIAKHAGSPDGATAIPHLFLSHVTKPNEGIRTLQWPCLALVASGAKSVTVGRSTLRYGVGDFLIVSLDLPVVTRVVKAPNLGIGLAIDPERLANLLSRVRPPDPAPTSLGVAVHRASKPLLGSVVRLLELLDHERDIPALAPLVEEEILYHLLESPAGPSLLRLACGDASTRGVVKAAEWLRTHLTEELVIAKLAARVGMSVSSLHHRFKAQTGLSPLQYQKQLRLNEARRLMLAERIDVAGAGYRVGYRSPAQFSREYARHHGAPPRQDVSSLLDGL